MSEAELSKEQIRVLVCLLDSKNKTAYDCRTTMRTIYALLERDLIKRTNYDDITWSGWERTGYEFKLTVFGKALAERFDVERKEAKPSA